MLWMLFSVLAGTSAAPVAISNCEIADESLGITALMWCDITNNGPSAVGQIRYIATVKDAAREIPWSKTPDHRKEVQTISGGIEPGETVRDLLSIPGFPERASTETMIVELAEIEAFGADGNPITPPKP